MSNRNAKWTNKDGLYVGFGTRKTEVNTSALHSPKGALQTLTVKIHGPSLKDAVAAADLENAAVIPADALLVSARLFVTTAFAGATATLDIGTYDASDNTAEDDDGIDAAIAVGTLTDNAVVTCDGAEVGTVMPHAMKIGASYDTAAFTAGEATLVIEYIADAA